MQHVEAQFESPNSKVALQDGSGRLMDEVIQSTTLTTDKNQSNSNAPKFSMQDVFDRMLQVEIYPGSNPLRTADNWKFMAPSESLTEGGQMRNATSFLVQNLNKLDNSKDGAVSKSELQSAFKAETNVKAKDQIENILANYDKLKAADFLDFSDGITMRDAEKASKKNEITEKAKALGQTLLDGKDPLFLVLDRSSNGDIDGVISQMDLVNFLAKCDRLEKAGNTNDGIHTPENQKLVSKMLLDWHKGDSAIGSMVERSAFDVLTSAPGVLTVESMAKAMHENALTEKGGYSQLKELKNRFAPSSHRF